LAKENNDKSDGNEKKDNSELGSLGEAGLAVYVIGKDKLPARSECLSLQSMLITNTVDLKLSVVAETGAILQDALSEVTLVIPGGALTKDLKVTVKKVSASNISNISSANSNNGNDNSSNGNDNSSNGNNGTLVKTDNLVLAYYNKD